MRTTVQGRVSVEISVVDGDVLQQQIQHFFQPSRLVVRIRSLTENRVQDRISCVISLENISTYDVQSQSDFSYTVSIYI